MIFHQTKYGYVVILKKGEQLIESLLTFADQQSIQSAWVNGLGAVMAAELGYYDLAKKEYSFKKFDRVLEIDSLTGNLAQTEAGTVAHIHVVLSDAELRTYGGHLKEAIVGGTCELHVQTIDTRLERKLDDETGLKLIR